MKLALAAASICLMLGGATQAQIRITEVAPWSSGNSPASLGADWFELTNFGGSSVNISGWTMDDNSNAFLNSVPLSGIASILAGESVIFVESAASEETDFENLWFGGSQSSLKVGFYTGSGVSLGTGGDVVNIYNGGGTLQTRLPFGASPASAPFGTFDNSAGLDNPPTLTQLSVVGINGAFAAFNDANEIGSPGSSVPEPGSVMLLLLGAGALAAAERRGRSRR